MIQSYLQSYFLWMLKSIDSHLLRTKIQKIRFPIEKRKCGVIFLGIWILSSEIFLLMMPICLVFNLSESGEADSELPEQFVHQ